jgi:hypothetical protein
MVRKTNIFYVKNNITFANFLARKHRSVNRITGTGSEHFLLWYTYSNLWIVKYGHELFSSKSYVKNLLHTWGKFSLHYLNVHKTSCVWVLCLCYKAASILPSNVCLRMGLKNIQWFSPYRKLMIMKLSLLFAFNYKQTIFFLVRDLF